MPEVGTYRIENSRRIARSGGVVETHRRKVALQARRRRKSRHHVTVMAVEPSTSAVEISLPTSTVDSAPIPEKHFRATVFDRRSFQR